jgi:hypothetical protein
MKSNGGQGELVIYAKEILRESLNAKNGARSLSEAEKGLKSWSHDNRILDQSCKELFD